MRGFFPIWVKTGLVVWAVAFAVLIPSVAPSIPGGHDSGELMSDALILGIPHPPGYPLYAMVGHLWSWLPLGELSYRMNLFSAFCLALAGGFTAAAATRVTSWQAGSAAGLMYCFAMSPWRQGVGAEVFAMHLAILSALVLAAIGWAQAETLPDRRRWMKAGCFIFGLGAAHHHTIILAVPGVLGFMIWSRGRRPWGLTWGAVAILLVTSFAPYSYLYIRASQDCPMNWSDPSNWKNFKGHVMREAYGSFSLNPSSGTVKRAEDAQVLAYFASMVRNQFPFPLIFLVAGGIAAALSRPRLLVLYGWILFMYGVGFSLIAKQPVHEFYLDMSDRFYSSSYIGAAGFIALALFWVQQRWRGTRWSRLSWGFPLLFLYTVALNWSACSEAGQYHPDDHMLAIMDYVEPNAVVLIDGDLPAGEYDYYQFVKHYRPDMLGVFPGLLAADWYRRDWMPSDLGAAFWKKFEQSGELDPMQSFVDTCRERGLTVYLTSRFGEIKRGQFYSEGLLFRYLKEDEPAPARSLVLERAQKAFDFLESRPRRGDYRLDMRNQTFWTRYLIGNWVRAYRQLARTLYPEDLVRAEAALRRALSMDPSLSDDWINLALLLEQTGRVEEANGSVDEALRRQPSRQDAMELKIRLCQRLGLTDQALLWSEKLQARRSAGR